MSSTYSKIRAFLAVEAAIFGLASLAHTGILLRGHEHWKAATAEGIIAAVLAAGLLACLMRPSVTRSIGIAAQGFALLGTLVGVVTIAIGIGPQSAADGLLHIIMLATLFAGLLTALKAGSGTPS
jgi:hypothetical protein